MFKNGGLRCGRNSQVNGFIQLNTNTFVLVPNYLLYMNQCSCKDTSTIGFGSHFAKWPATPSKANSELALYQYIFVFTCSKCLGKCLAFIIKRTIHKHIGCARFIPR